VYHLQTSKMTPCLRELVFEFGENIIAQDGSLDRVHLASIVFAEDGKDARYRLNKITHKHVLREIRSLIQGVQDEYSFVIVDAPLLFESGFDSECDLIVSVIAPRDIRIKRIVERDFLTEEAACRRIDAQLSDEFLRSHSDFVINNDGDMQWLENQANRIINYIKRGK